MNQPACFSAAASPMPVAPKVLLTRGPPATSKRATPCEGTSAFPSAQANSQLAEGHDRIAQGLNDLVVRRIFAAGLELQAALPLIGDHPGAGQIHRAVDELDQAIRDIRNTIFGRAMPARSGGNS